MLIPGRAPIEALGVLPLRMSVVTGHLIRFGARPTAHRPDVVDISGERIRPPLPILGEVAVRCCAVFVPGQSSGGLSAAASRQPRVRLGSSGRALPRSSGHARSWRAGRSAPPACWSGPSDASAPACWHPTRQRACCPYAEDREREAGRQPERSQSTSPPPRTDPTAAAPPSPPERSRPPNPGPGRTPPSAYEPRRLPASAARPVRRPASDFGGPNAIPLRTAANLRHLDHAAIQVDVARTERGQLAPAQIGQRSQDHQRDEARRHALSQREDLLKRRRRPL
jgi:hypothetical protein